MIRIALVNLPWPHPEDPLLWGVRAGSRWPHFQTRCSRSALPRYIPFPFMLATAAAELQRRGHSVLLVDGVAEAASCDTVRERVFAFDPEVLFAETSSPSLDHDVAVLAEWRKGLPKCEFGCGGIHDPEIVQRLIRERGIPDFWIAGEYEISLADWIAGGRLKVVPGMIRGDHPFSGFAGIHDLGALPSPAYDQLPIRNYCDPVCGLPTPNAQTYLSRGCPFQCTFCVWPQLLYGNRNYRVRPIAKALDEIETLIKRHGCESFYFDDDTANIGEARMLELAAMIRQRGLDAYPWAMMARADCMTEDMLNGFADAGMYAVKYGVESVSPRLIDACNKGTRLEQMIRMLEKTRALGIKIHLTFTFGLPGETPETIRETVRFAVEFAPESAQFSICTPFPGTVFHRECIEKRFLVTDDCSKLTGDGSEAVVQTPSLSAGQLVDGFHAAIGTWRAFIRERDSNRRKRMTDRLRREVESGAVWHFAGDFECLDDLCSDPTFKERFGGDLTACSNPGDHTIFSPKVLVILSPHDEEKIYRRLLRRFPDAMRRTRCLRIHG